MSQIDLSTRYYRSRSTDHRVAAQAQRLAQVRVRYGYRRLHILLQREGWKVNHKLVYRLYTEEGLSLRIKKKKKCVSATRVKVPQPAAPNEVWSMDFVVDGLANGQAIRALTLVDNYSRESLSIEVDFSLTGKRVVEVLERVAKRTASLGVIKCDTARVHIKVVTNGLIERV